MDGWIRLGVVVSVVWMAGAWFWAESQVAEIEAEIEAESYQDCSQYSETHIIDSCEKRNEVTRAMAASGDRAGQLSDLRSTLFALALLPLFAAWLGSLTVFWIRGGRKKRKAQ